MYIKRIRRIIRTRSAIKNSLLKQNILRYISSNTRYIQHLCLMPSNSSELLSKNKMVYRFLLDSLNFYKMNFSSYSLANRARNHCLITTRSRSVYNFCKLTRMQIKKFINKDLLPGIRPSS